MSDGTGQGKRKKACRVAGGYLEASFAWRIKRLTPAQQLRLYARLGVLRRLWWEWTEEGWREIR